MEIVIRHAEPSDYEAIYRIYTSPTTVAGTLQMPHQPAELYRKRYAETPDNHYNLVAAVEGEVVGTIGFTVLQRARRRHAGSIGMVVRDDWQGRGIGSALLAAVLNMADNWLNLRRVELEVWVDNAPAIALYQKFGFEIEGTLREYAFRDGHYVDAYAMARLHQT